MPPALHPRSRQTLSLFTTTLILSFLVVGTPHILPCPADRRVYADSSDPDALNRKPRRRRRGAAQEGDAGAAEEAVKIAPTEEMRDHRRRECPVPKPGGLLGQILGVKDDPESNRTIMREIRIERLKEGRTTRREGSE